jgi:hypothetical protein
MDQSCGDVGQRIASANDVPFFEKGIPVKSFIIACITAALALSFATPVHAKDVVEHKMSDDDVQKVDAIADAFFSKLIAGEAPAAIEGFLGTSKLMAGKTVELTNLISQINTGSDIYGPISACVLVSKKGRGGIVEEQQYLCQHEHFITRWKLAFAKTSKGWIASNLYFDDRATSDD